MDKLTIIGEQVLFLSLELSDEDCKKLDDALSGRETEADVAGIKIRIDIGNSDLCHLVGEAIDPDGVAYGTISIEGLKNKWFLNLKEIQVPDDDDN